MTRSDPTVDDRKTARAAERGARDAPSHADVMLEDYAQAKTILRSSGARQAGFGADFAGGLRMRRPILFLDGEMHRRLRAATARFFAPSAVSARYRGLIERESEALVGGFATAGRARLDDLTLALSVSIAAEIVGLTASDQAAMAHRIDAFFASAGTSAATRMGRIRLLVIWQWRLLRFYLGDVRPAIRIRRRERREDIISHLLDEGYSSSEILIECLTIAAAGMATTREFIAVAGWHLLERDDLRAHFLAADATARTVLLEEILRLEPVVGTLFRRVAGADAPSGVAPKAIVGLDIRATNAGATTGRCPFTLDPARGAGPGLSFGDGPHRCPGASIALLETSVFLDRLLRLPNLRLVTPPSVHWNPLTAGYELRGMEVRCGDA